MPLPNFLGRTHELALLNRLTDKQAASLVVVSGRRRIGKSRLIQEFGKQFAFYSFTGLPPISSKNAEQQRAYFAKQLAQQCAMPLPPSEDWADLFWFLAYHLKKARVVVLLDELSWMAQGDPLFLGKLKTAWDDHFKQNPKLILVLCSSVSLWMEKNILSDKGFMGRRSLHLYLNELPLEDCSQFWGGQASSVSAFEKLKFLAVSGGVPRYLEELKPYLSAEENIKQLCFEKSGILFREFDDIFSDLFMHNTDKYQTIIWSLAEGSQTYTDLCKVLKTTPNRVISLYLEELEKAGFISRDYGWHFKTGSTSKLSQFRLSDNYMRFYCKYIYPNKRRIENDEFVDASISTVISWETIMGLQFENLVLNNRRAIKRILGIQPGETIAEGSYFQKQTTKHAGCQIDYLIQTKFNQLYLCEVKFSKSPIGLSVVEACRQKTKKLQIPQGFSYRSVLIHVNGVEDRVITEGYFAKIINFSELLTR